MPLHYELSDLRLLLILMRTRSLSASGEAAHLTTSAVSLRLRKLEDGIGAQLFTRTGKGLVPTGRSCSAHSCRIGGARRTIKSLFKA